jgi:hypothetical protein
VRETLDNVREAGQRGHLYATLHLRTGWANLAWLAMDEPEEALAQVDLAMSEWSKRGFQVEHYREFIARTNALLYSGRAREAHAYLTASWPALHRSLLPHTIQCLRIFVLHARARSALAAAVEGGDDHARLLRDAARAARRIEGERADWATAKAKLLRAGIAAAGTAGAGTEGATSLLREAIAGFDAADMALYGAAARRCLGGLLGGDEGRGLVRDANAWMMSERIKNPARMTALLAPGFRPLD